MKRCIQCFLIFGVLLQASMIVQAVSAAVSLGSSGREFECDGTERLATVNAKGGSIYNKSTDSVWINLEAGTVGTSSGGIDIEIKTGVSIKLPSQCGSFTFKTAGGTSYLIWVGP